MPHVPRMVRLTLLRARDIYYLERSLIRTLRILAMILTEPFVIFSFVVD